MRNTIRIPKKHTWIAGSLVCDNLIVHGELTITGALAAKRVMGRGSVDAGTITAETISCGVIRADELTARRVSSKSVTAGIIRLGDAFKNAYAENAVDSAPGVDYNVNEDGVREDNIRETDEAVAAEFFDVDTAELDVGGDDTKPDDLSALLDDPAFLRLRAMYAMEREYGGAWRLELPNKAPDAPDAGDIFSSVSAA